MFPFRLLRNCSVAPLSALLYPSRSLPPLPSSDVDMAKKRKSRVTAAHDAASPSEVDHDTHVPEDTQKTLYEIIGVERTASQQEIKKAYYKLALRLHPDKNPGDEEANEKFQQLQKVISILGDEEKRAIYDQTGCIDDADLAGDMASNLQEYFRAMYKKVTEADIEEFEANYRGSETEIKDLKDLYVKCKGNMNRLFCSMICSEPKLDSHRFKDIIDEAISSGELKSTKAYQKWAKIVSATEPPVNPLKRRPKKSKKDSESDLVAAIVQRRSERKEQFESMFSTWTKKYGEGPSLSEPSEEEFEAARKRLENKKQQDRKQKGR